MALRLPRIRWTVRRKLVLSSVTTLLSLSLFAYLSIQSSIGDLKRDVQNRSLSTSTLVELTVRDYLDQVERQLTSFAEIPAVGQGDEETVGEVFRDLSFRYPRYANLFIARPDGRVLGKAAWESRLPENLSGERFFLDAVRTGELSVSSRVMLQGSVGPAVHAAMPLKDYAGRVTGVLGATLSLAELQYNVMQIRAAELATVIVTDCDGTTLLHPDVDELISGRRLDGLDFVGRALRGESGYVSASFLGLGENWLGVFKPIPRVSWALIVAYPESSTGELVRQAILRNGVYLFLAVLLVVPTALLLVGRIARDLSRLSSQVRALAQPEEGEGSGAGGDEVKELEVGFASMARRLATTRQEMEKKGQELQKRLARQGKIREEERRRLALDVHDGVAQYVVCALQQARETERHLSASSEAAASLRAAQDLLDQALLAMDSVIFSLRPPGVPEGGLLSAIQGLLLDLEESQRVVCSLSIHGAIGKLPRELELVAYRVVQEALNNVRRHSEADNVVVTLRQEAGDFTLAVVDNGQGFDPVAVESGDGSCLGISGMRERAAGVGGSCWVESSPGRGTSVTLRLPVAHAKRQPRGPARTSTGPLEKPRLICGG